MTLLQKQKNLLNLLFSSLLALALPFHGLAQFYDCEEELFSKKDKATRLFGYINMLGEFRVPPVFLKALPFVGKNAIVQQGKKFGIINCEGVLVVPAEYDEIASFSNEKGWMKAGNLWGLTDVKGKRLIPPMYEEIKEVNIQNGTATWVKKNGLWGLISKENGRFLVPSQYENISSISDSAGIGKKEGTQDLIYYGDGRIIISSMRSIKKLGTNLFAYENVDTKFGAFNSLAYILIRPQWDELTLNGSLIQVKAGNKYGLKSTKGAEVAPVEYEYISEFKNGFYAASLNGNWLIINIGNISQTPKEEFSNAIIIGKEWAILEKKNQQGLWNLKSKKWQLPLENQLIRSSNDETWLEIRKNNQALIYRFESKSFAESKWDSISTTDPNELIRAYKNKQTFLTSFPKFESTEPFDVVNVVNSKLAIVSKNGLFGTMISPNQVGFPVEYQSITEYRNQSTIFLKVSKQNLSGIGNSVNKILIQPAYQDIKPTNQTVYLAKQKMKWGLLATNETWIEEPKFDSITLPKRNETIADFPVVAWKGQKNQLINNKGEELTELDKHIWIYLGEGVWGNQKQNGIGLFNESKKISDDLVFEKVLPYSGGKAPVFTNGKWGFVNTFGKLVIDAKYDSVFGYKNGIAFVSQNGKWGVLKSNGAWLVKPIGISTSVDKDGNRKLVMP